MNIKQILIVACLGVFISGGTAKADDPNEQMRWAFNLIAHLLGGANDSSIKSEIDKFCDPAANPPNCDKDIWSDNITGNFDFPNSLAGVRKTNLITAFRNSPLLKANVCNNHNQYCDKGYSDLYPNIPARIMQAACDEVGCNSGDTGWETHGFSGAIWSEPKLSLLVEANCKSYCSADKSLCAGGDGALPRTWAGAQCIYDAFKANPDVSFPFLLKHQNLLLPYGGTPVVPIPVVGAVCEKFCTKAACNLSYKQNDCMSLCCGISHGAGATTDYLRDCESNDPGPATNLCKNFLQTQQWQHSTQGNHQSKANAVMAPAPLVIRQDNKALRGNAPQTIRERGTNQNRQSRTNLQTGQPRVMPPLNQGKLPQRKTQHPGMMHVDPHHQGMLPPVNQGRNAPSVNTKNNHPGMRPVENRGRTTPPKMRPMPNRSNSSQHMQPSSGGSNMQSHPGMMPVPNQGQSAPSQNVKQSNNHGLMRPLPPHLVEIERPTQPER